MQPIVLSHFHFYLRASSIQGVYTVEDQIQVALFARRLDETGMADVEIDPNVNYV
jgi:hypothetical protein